MSGNYDYPRAGNASRASVPPAQSERRPEITARLRHLRELLDSDRQRDRQRLALETLDSELLHMSNEPISSRLERRRRGLEAQLRGFESSSVQPSESNTASPDPTLTRTPTISRSRRRPVRPSDRLQRYREQSDSPSPSDLESMRSDLESIRSRSRLIDPTSTLSPIMSDRPPRIGTPPYPDFLAQEYSTESRFNGSDDRWRAKRRKLDSDDTRNTPKGFRYGHYGQVVPGRLKMEIVSCDGGQYTESNGGESWPGHVLQDDKSVYCTKSDRCNLILRHEGETTFCLRKLVIKAPKSGFDAAIQEGMIFVSMEKDDLLDRTNCYQIQYSPHHRRRRPAQGQGRLPPSHEYFNSVRSPLRSLDEPSASTQAEHPEDPSPGTPYRTPFNVSPADIFPGNPRWRQSPDVSRGFVSSNSHTDDLAESHPNVPRVPGFRVTTEYEDKSDDGVEDKDPDPDDFNTAAEMEFDRLVSLHDRYLARWGDLNDRYNHSEHPDSSDDSDGWDENLVADAERVIQRRPGEPYFSLGRRRRVYMEGHRARRRSTPSHIRFDDSGSRNVPHRDTHPAGSYGGSGVSGRNVRPLTPEPHPNPLIPHTSFFIQRERDLVAIKFDPPVSGKFILIKLWAPCPNANIDIQSIIAHGFAGPRFFPAITVR